MDKLDSATINKGLAQLPGLISRQEQRVQEVKNEYSRLLLSLQQKEAEIITDESLGHNADYRKAKAIAHTAGDRRLLLGKKEELEKAKIVYNTLINKWKAVRKMADLMIKGGK